MKVLIKKARIVDPSLDAKEVVMDILIEKGHIVQIESSLSAPDARLIEGNDLHVFPGFFDIGVQANDPGMEYREDFDSLRSAAAAGGYTGVAVFPNTKPTMQSKSEIKYCTNYNADAVPTELIPIGAISENCSGEELAEILDMKEAGARAFSDGKYPLQSAGLMQRILEYARIFDGLIINRPVNTQLIREGQMHEGYTSTTLGLKGVPSLVEELMLKRDIALLEYTQSRLLVHCLSSAEGVELVRKAKADGLDIKASVSIWSLIYTEESLVEFDTNYKMQPVLRSAEDKKALIEGVLDGTIDIIVSNHDPKEQEVKFLEFPYAESGVIGLQTVLAAYEMELSDKIPLQNFIQCISINSRKALNVNIPSVSVGQRVNIVVFDKGKSWVFDKNSNQSKSINSPFWDKSLPFKHVVSLNGLYSFNY